MATSLGASRSSYYTEGRTSRRRMLLSNIHRYCLENLSSLLPPHATLSFIPVKHHGRSTQWRNCVPGRHSHFFVRVDSHRMPLQRPYQGPFPVVARTPKTYTLRIRDKDQVISVDRLKPAFLPSAPMTNPPAARSHITTRSGRQVRPPFRFPGEAGVAP